MEKKIKIKLPSVPNFILPVDFDEGIPISDFTEEELREIGRNWTEELVKKAESKRIINK